MSVFRATTERKTYPIAEGEDIFCIRLLDLQTGETFWAATTDSVIDEMVADYAAEGFTWVPELEEGE